MVSQIIRGTRREAAKARRAQILDEAIRVIGERGYRGFTIQQLAKNCGLTNGGVLYHFPSKENVLVAVLEELERRMVAGITSYMAETVGIADEADLPREKVLHILRAILVQSLADPEIVRLNAVLQLEALDPAHPAHGHISQSHRSTFVRFAKLFEPLSEEPASAARQALAMMNGLFLHSLEDDSFDLLDEWDRAIARILPETVGEGKE